MSRGWVVAVLTTVLVSGCTGASGDTDTSGYVSGAGQITVVPAADREDAPVLSGEDLEGAALTTADWAGQTIVVNVWGPWCPPCRKEMPALKEVSEQYADQDVKFVGVLNRSKSDTALAFTQKIGITYPTFADQGGRLELKFNDSLPTVAVPTTWIIDANGKVAARIAVDDLTASTLAGLVDDVKASS
ncbi:MAG: TlpA disulfide reductase family protein [Aeromicrobium sp.]|uniref:TlpA family protein disulfide reductase n=1 Tax=Aeromicrobium sp. TaxID=1871063 RepID=UPI003C5AD506